MMIDQQEIKEPVPEELKEGQNQTLKKDNVLPESISTMKLLSENLE